MGALRNLRLRIHRYFFQKEVAQLKRQPRSVNFEKAHSIGILFDATELPNRETALAYKEKLVRQGKRIHMLGYFDDNLSDSNFTFQHFNNKQLDWALRPKSTEVREFIDTPFDLLINIEPTTRTHSEYIAALSKAHLKVGPFTVNTDCYDLMIEPADPRNTEAFIQQIEALLKITNTEKNEAANV